jgi:outer membrane protein TolC
MVRAGYAETMAEGDGFMVMVGVSLPIWRGKLRSGVEEARAMHGMAVADMDAMRRMIQGSAMAARDALEAEQTRYRALRDDVVPRAKRLMGPAIGLYASGQGSMAGVIEAAQALWSAQQDLVMAESALGVAWARLHRMAGTSLESPL